MANKEITTERKQFFEDFEVGDTATSTVARTISEYEHYVICGLYGTYSDLHMNEPLQKSTEWGGRLVPAVGLGVIMLGLFKRTPWQPDARALYGFDNVRFINPVLIGDTVYLEAEILETRDREDDSERGLLRVKEDLMRTEDGHKENGELVATRERMFLCGREP